MFIVLVSFLLFQPTLSFFDVKEALSLDPENIEADGMYQSLEEKAENFKENVNIPHIIFSRGWSSFPHGTLSLSVSCPF